MSRKFAFDRVATVSILALAVAMPQIAVAQDAGGADSSGSASTSTIVVTGTRLSSGFDAPTPVSVVTSAEIARAAPPTIADFVNQLPALSGSNSPRTSKAAIGNGLVGGNFLNLRNLGNQRLGTTRTLVLLDGRRATPSTLTGAVDVNLIPNALIKRVDVVTGGASAAWGSDAVAGVVNFVLDKDYTGLKGSGQAGISSEGDGENYTAELTFGTSFGGGRGHFLLSGAYSKMEEALYSDRGWFKASKIVPNPQYGAAGEPRFLSAPWSTVLTNSTGLFASGPLAGYYFDEAGKLAGTDFPTGSFSSIYSFGDKAVYGRLTDQSALGQASIPMEQWSVFGRASYDVTDTINAYVQGSFSKMKSAAAVANYWQAGTVSVAADNYYLPDAVRQAMVDAGITRQPLSMAYTKLGYINNKSSRELASGVVGLEGEFGKDWHWNAYYQYGKAKTRLRAEGMPRPGPIALAIDAVDDPANPGQPICRSSIADPGNGCIPMNPLGSQAVGAAVLSDLVGTSAQDIDYTQTVAALGISGNLLDLPAGPLSFAAGAEYRTEKAVASTDPISEVNGFWAGNFKDFHGKYNVKEIYAELGVPVFADSSLGRNFSLNLAGRYTDYSVSGSVATWKIGARYEVIDGLEFRVTRSRDIRAPNLQELFQPGLVGNQGIFDPFVQADTRMTQTISGNIDLDPEKANTLTAGVVIQPAFMPGLRLSVDYYDIKIKDAIASNSSQFIVNQCFNKVQVYCDAMTFNTDGSVATVNLKPFNAQLEQARGVDIEASYRTGLGSGALEFRAMANYVNKLDIVTVDSTISRAGEVGNNVGAAEGVPSWRALASATWVGDPLTLQLKGRFIGAAKQDRQWGPADIDKNNVPSVFYLDAFVGIDVPVGSGKGQFFIAADNLLNKNPPVVTPNDTANSTNSGTNPFIYDVMGRMMRAGFKFEF